MLSKDKVTWDLETDVVVLGSGGAALTTAIRAADEGAEVVILEKSDLVGGTTAFSGGIPWIPENRYMKEKGINDSFEEAKKYVSHLTGGREPDPKLVDLYINEGKHMIDYLYEKTPVRFTVPRGYGDYYANNPGGKNEGRSLDPVPFALTELGEWEHKIRRHPIFPPLTLAEGGASDPSKADFSLVAERMEKNITTMGRALIGGLFKTVLDLGVKTYLSTPGEELVMDDDGAVVGVRAVKDGEDFFIGARKGVMIATGGFEWNEQLVNTFLSGPITHPQSPAYNEGDGLIMAMEAGAALGNMDSAWWSPAFVDPTIEYEGRVYNQIDQSARTMANTIMVNKSGKRFVNEGATYQDLPKAFYTYDQNTQSLANSGGAWMIFDQQLKDRALIVTMAPGEDAPDWVTQSDSIEGLAKQMDIAPEVLVDTVNHWNENARNHVDPDFGRGGLYFGNMATGGAGVEAMIGPIEKGPFYALPVYQGALGTNGGPRIDEHGQVISLRGELIPGLYAAGNAAMGVLGGAYPGAGGTIGPALTFGYLAGKHLANTANRDL